MIHYLGKLLGFTTHDDADPARVAHIVIRFGILLYAIAALFSLIIKPVMKSNNDLIISSSLLFVYLCAFQMLRSGHQKFSLRFLVVALVGLTTLFALNSPEFLALPVSSFIVAVLMSSLLLDKTSTKIIFVYIFLMSALIIFLHETGVWRMQLIALDRYASWISLATMFFWVAFLVYLSNREVQIATYRLDQNAQKLAASLEELQASRNAQVAYSHDLERRVVQLQVAADIARDAATLLEVDGLLKRAVNMVRDRFGFYHAGIFMVDERKEYAVLKAATGEAGKQMIEAGHQLKVGEVGIVGRVTSTGQPRVVVDVDHDEVYFHNPYLPETHSELTLPLITGDQVIGALDVQSREQNAFDDEDIIILQTMADQLATAIAHARLFEATRRQVRELTALHAVATAGAEARSEDELIERATQMIAEVFFPDNFGVLLLDEKTGQLHHHPSYREKVFIQHLPISIGEGVVGLTVKQKSPCRIADVSKNAAYIPIDPQTRSELCVPIKVDEHILGVINAESAQFDYFNADDERLLATFAGQLGLAVEKIRLIESESRRVAELEALRLASLHLNSNLKIDTVLEDLLDQSIRMSAADTAHLFLYDGKKLTFACASWAEGHQQELHDVPHPTGLTYQVARSGKPMIVTDARTHPIFHERAWDGAVVGMPIFTGSKVLGVMNLAYHSGTHEFDEHELRALAMLADHAAVAIINANLYTEAQIRAQQLTEALLQREELDRMKNEFIQNVSHELRTPLAIVHGYTDLLKTGELGPLNDDQIDAVNTLARRIQFLTKLVDDLVVILEAEGRDLARELIPLNEVVLRSVHDFKAAAQQASVELEAVLPEDIIFIEGNYTHLNRLMDNLIGNAIKFTPADGSIKVMLSHSQDEIIITVSDTGIGISPDKIKHIFERFYQVDGTTKRRYGGFGLGLSLVKEIVTAHGGKINVQSELGKGSTFTVLLPLPQ